MSCHLVLVFLLIDDFSSSHKFIAEKNSADTFPVELIVAFYFKISIMVIKI